MQFACSCYVSGGNDKRTTIKLHPNYKQTTSKLLECTSKLLEQYMHTTSNVHPNYEEGIYIKELNIFKFRGVFLLTKAFIFKPKL